MEFLANSPCRGDVPHVVHLGKEQARSLLEVAGVVGGRIQLSLDDFQRLPGQVPDVARLVPGRVDRAVRLTSILGGAAVLPWGCTRCSAGR
ncbi:MAG: hypothetical protein ACI8TX_003352 [Hyphomicrobiaceae bacterium]|jgi:hypothetical protein